MQRDLKVGLSLGVLVLGVVGALLFRRDQQSETPKPTLKTARKIDERIAEGPRTPYMTGDVEFDQDDGATSNRGLAADDQNGRPAHAVAPGWLNDEEDPFRVTKSDRGGFDFHGTSPTDNPVVPVKPRNPAQPRSPELVGVGLQTHVIQSGDSLSTLAAKYLGGQGKFQELFDANRDVLTDPNRLPLGATIVIPAHSRTATKPDGTTVAKSLAGHPEQVRGTITDVSTIDPLTPTKPAVGGNANPESAKSADQVATTPPVPTKPREAKKFFAPVSTPFANHTRRATVNPHRKPLDPEGEDLIGVKPLPATDAAHSTTESSRHYQVLRGDSLEKISLKVYGNAKRSADIFAANRAQLSRPESLREGQDLILPE